LFALRLKLKIVFVFEDPGHNEVKQDRRAQAYETKINKAEPDFVGADAQSARPPFADAKGLQLEEENYFL
jgi:hypothetical protein